MASAFNIVMEHRRELVERVIDMMKKDGFFNNAWEWDRTMFRPHNPLSDVFYKGGNRFRLMLEMHDKGYQDPRWATFKQYKEKGFYPKKGEERVLCEKWIFTREKTILNENNEKVRVIEELEIPQVSYFKVFNAEQIQDFPVIEFPEKKETPIFEFADRLIETSECPVLEKPQDRAYYSPAMDQIVLPLRNLFKDDVSFAKTLLHEMGHSTGHLTRLNREFASKFEVEKYAKEELRAELGAMFAEADFGIQLKGEHYEDHSDYLKSWIGALQNDYNEFFRACADAEKISERLVQNYSRKYILQNNTVIVNNDIMVLGKKGIRSEKICRCIGNEENHSHRLPRKR